VQLAHKTPTNQPTQASALKFYAQIDAAAAAAAGLWPSLQTQGHISIQPTTIWWYVMALFILTVRRSGGQ